MNSEIVNRSLKGSFPDDISELPEGSVIDGGAASHDVSDIADYVIIGSGAGGATAAFVLSSAGYSVVILEEGPWVRTRDFELDVFPSMKKLFRDAGTQVTTGSAIIPVLQGRCVGGSTTINSAIAWRAPESVVDRWNSEFDLQGAISYKTLEPQYDELDRALSVRPVNDSALGKHSSLFAEAALKLGIRAERIQRYDGGCAASAGCLTGCRSGKKLSMNLTHIPMALHRGARIYTSSAALRVESLYGRARAVHAEFLSSRSSQNLNLKPKLKVIARRGVILAASAVQTPQILKRSGVRLPALGKHFQAHAGTSLTGRFDGEVSMQVGATQGFNSTHFVDVNRFKVETLALPPELLAVRIPGVGPEFMSKILDYKHVLNWALVVRAEAEGQVRSVLGKTVIQYTPTLRDMDNLKQGLKVLSEMMFAAGAKEVWPNFHGVPILRSLDDLHFWDEVQAEPRSCGMMLSHLFGSARMGSDDRNSVVGLDFQVHGIRGLYVLDSSLFPTNTGVNPQHTIMAVARLGASRIAETPLPICS